MLHISRDQQRAGSWPGSTTRPSTGSTTPATSTSGSSGPDYRTPTRSRSSAITPRRRRGTSSRPTASGTATGRHARSCSRRSRSWTPQWPGRRLRRRRRAAPSALGRLMADSTTPVPVCTRPAAQVRHPPEGGGGAATIPLRRARPCIHGPRTSGHGGRKINHLESAPMDLDAVEVRVLGAWSRSSGRRPTSIRSASTRSAPRATSRPTATPSSSTTRPRSATRCTGSRGGAGRASPAARAPPSIATCSTRTPAGAPRSRRCSRC